MEIWSNKMEIMALKPEQRKTAARTVSAAFYDYPSLCHYFPDPKRRTRWLPWYMGRVLNCAQKFGEVWVTEDTSCVLFILPPNHTRLTSKDYIKSGMLTVPLIIGLGRYQSVDECELYLADTQERLLAGRSHYYLWGLAVDPSRQRKGVGTALLEAFLEKADEEKLPVYLETHKEANVSYYENRGFKLIGSEIIPKHNLRFWCLLHEPSDIK